MTALEWDAALYAAKHSFVYEYGRELVTVLAPQRGERILDLGCGSGQLTRAIAESGARVTGLDNSASMINTARREYPDVSFVLADAKGFSSRLVGGAARTAICGGMIKCRSCPHRRRGDLSFDGKRRGLMNYYTAKELADSFRTVRKNTIIIAQDVPPEKYAFRAAPETRSVGELLVHIALAPNFQYQVHAIDRRTTLEGFDFPSLMKRFAAEEKEPRSKDQILEMIRSSGEKWAGWVEGLTEDFLAEQVQMSAGTTPPSKSRFEMILSVKEHEMHHRGQLMLIERLFGIVPHMTREMQSRLTATAAKS